MHGGPHVFPLFNSSSSFKSLNSRVDSLPDTVDNTLICFLEKYENLLCPQLGDKLVIAVGFGLFVGRFNCIHDSSM